MIGAIKQALSKMVATVAPAAPPAPPKAPYGTAWAIGLIKAGIAIQHQREKAGRFMPTPPRMSRQRRKALAAQAWKEASAK